jgi:N-acetylglucosaminyldiphosphoundecaprenol N-acetyl-beta-D-mannosaminyltransferase
MPIMTGVAIPRWRVLKMWVDGFTVASFVETVGAAVDAGRTVVVAHHNVASLALYQRDDAFRAFFGTADAIYIDGMPVVSLARLAGAPARRSNRITVLDWFWPLCGEAERAGWQVVHLGSEEEVLQRARQVITERHPRLRLTTLPGFFDMCDPQESTAVLAAIGAAQPAVLLVGMGMPRQEHWILSNLQHLPPCVVVTVGGILGYIGNDRPTPPRWLGRLGLEWLFRLVTEPRRLWRRYLVDPVALAPLLLAEVAHWVGARWGHRR